MPVIAIMFAMAGILAALLVIRDHDDHRGHPPLAAWESTPGRRDGHRDPV